MIPTRAWLCAVVVTCTAMLGGCESETVVNGKVVSSSAMGAPTVRMEGGKGGTWNPGGGGGGMTDFGGKGGDTSAAVFGGADDKVYIAPAGEGNDPSLDWSDPCANNLVGLSGQLLLYYSMHRGFPETLTDLPASPDKETVSLTCPETGKPYIYHPQGYRAPPEMIAANWPEVTLILYDAVAAHKMTQHLTDGTKKWDKVVMVRYGIVADPPNNGAMKLHVVPLEDKLLGMFLRPSQMYVQPRKP